MARRILAEESEPADDDAWKGSIEQIDIDLDEFIELLEHSNIYQPWNTVMDKPFYVKLYNSPIIIHTT